MTQINNGEIVPGKAGDKVMRSASLNPRTGLPMPVSKGRPLGALNRTTLESNIVKARARAAMGDARILDSMTPLDVMLRFMTISVDKYERLAATKPPINKKLAEDHFKRIRQAEATAMSCAVDAAPYCHSKLQTIDKTVKKGVVIQVLSFRDAPAIKTVTDESTT